MRSPSFGDLICIQIYQCLEFGESAGPGIRVGAEAGMGDEVREVKAAELYLRVLRSTQCWVEGGVKTARCGQIDGGQLLLCVQPCP